MAVITTNTNLTAVSYVAGEVLDIQNNATLTINSTPTIRPGNVQALARGRCLITNSSTTTPIVITLNANNVDFIFTGNGILEIQGQMIQIATGTGAAGQTISFASINGVSIDYPTYVEVETASGSNIYRPWYVVPGTGTTGTLIYSNLSQFANGIHGNVALYNATTQVLTFGDGTAGNVIPSGARVRIPNIHLTSASNIDLPSGRTLIALTPSGTFTANCCSISNAIALNFSNFKAVSLTRVGFTARNQSLPIGATTGSISLNNVIKNPDPRNETNLQVTNVLGLSSIDLLYSMTLSTSAIVLQYLPNNQQIRNLEGVVLGRGAVTNNAVSLLGLSGTIENLTTIGGRILVDTCTNVFVRNITHSDQTNNTLSTAVATNMVSIANSTNTVVRTIQLAGNSPPRLNLFNFDAGCVNTTISDFTINGASHTQDLIVATGRNTLIANATFNNSRFTPFVPAMSGSGLVLRNVQNNQAHTLPLATGTIFDNVQASAISTSLPNYNDAGVFSVITDNPRSTGQLVLGPFGSKLAFDLYTITGIEDVDWYFNNNGAIFLISNGVVATFRSINPIRSITSFRNILPVLTSTATSGLASFEFRISNPGSIASASWQTLDQATLISGLAGLTGYSSDVGFDIEIRITSIGSDATRSISRLTMFTNNDAAFSPKVGSVATILTNGINGSTARLFDRTNPSNLILLDRETIAGGTCRLNGGYDFDGTTIPTSVKVVDYRYTRISLDSAYANLDVSIPLAPELDGTITESNQPTVEAYTHANTLERVRDLCKSWTINNFELYYPSIDIGLCTVVGTVLDFGSINVVFDGTASQTRSVNTSTNTVTFRTSSALSGVAFNTIKTTGLITLVNGATQGDVTFIDANGTRAPETTLTIVGIVPDSEVVIRISGTSTQLLKQDVAGTSTTYGYITPGEIVDIAVIKEGYQTWQSKRFVLPASSQELRVDQQISTAWRP